MSKLAVSAGLQVFTAHVVGSFLLIDYAVVILMVFSSPELELHGHTSPSYPCSSAIASPTLSSLPLVCPQSWAWSIRRSDDVFAGIGSLRANVGCIDFIASARFGTCPLNSRRRAGGAASSPLTEYAILKVPARHCRRLHTRKVGCGSKRSE